MAAKKYRCKIEMTTQPQASGKRLTFYPGDVVDAKFLSIAQVERLLGMGVIEGMRKVRVKTLHAHVEDVDGA